MSAKEQKGKNDQTALERPVEIRNREPKWTSASLVGTS